MTKRMQTQTRPLLAVAAIAALSAACAATPQSAPPTGTPVPVTGGGSDPASPPTTPATPTLRAFTSSGHPSMDAWRNDFAQRALASGRDADVIYATLARIKPLALYLDDDVSIAKTGIADQAEFAKPIWDYVASAVSEGRKTRGAQKLTELDATFNAIEAAYGVDREALTAIWAMETNLGTYIGDFDAPNTLANMAVEGRRKSFAERELTNLMKIQERGDAERDDLISGWAGAMGQTQFMPSTFYSYAVDFDGDGKKNVWGSQADALASAANYLAVSGYQTGMPWGLEVRPTGDMDWSLADGQDRRISTWKSAGLTPMDGSGFAIDDGTYAELWLPTGATGPKYLLFKNFDVYKTYNRSDSYAFSVGLLTDGVAGKNGPVAAWPKHLELLTKQQVMVMQDYLNRLGHNAGVVDGIAGRGTRGALQRFQKANGYVADGYPTKQAFDQVVAAIG